MKQHLPKHLLIFGAGYVAHHVAEQALGEGWSISISSCTPQTHQHDKITYFKFGDDLPPHVDAVLSTVPPRDGQDPVLATYHQQLPEEASWFGYLSSTGVYGDAQGEPVTEKSPLLGASPRAQARIAAEAAWQTLEQPVHIFRLSGIYGPKRNMLERLKEGRIYSLEHSDRPVNRIHVKDIAQTVLASLDKTNDERARHEQAPFIYNLADDLPAPTKDVITYAAKLLDMPTPPPNESTTSHLHDGSRIVVNKKIKQVFGITLFYPTFREGLDGLIDSL